LNCRFKYYSFHKRHFLQNELSWEYSNLADFNPLDLDCSSQEKTVNIVLIGNSYGDIEVLDKFPRGSVWAMLYGDETFQFSLTLRTLLKRSVKGILRVYPLPHQPVTSFPKVFTSLEAFRIKPRHIPHLTLDVFRGLVIWFRQISLVFLHWSFRKPHLTTPIGYTNLFYEVFCARFGLKEGNSVFKKFGSMLESSRQTQISFVGQRGKIWRRLVTEEALNFFRDSQAEILIRENFGGTNGSNSASSQTAMEFIDIAHRSRFALCPPGNFSSATFRWLESIACGALPLEIQSHPTDPGYRSAISSQSFSNINHWSKLFELTLTISEEERIAILVDLKSKTLECFSALNQALVECQ